jgi:cyclase
VDAILNLGDANSLIVPGHGKPGDKQQLKLFRQNTLQWVAQVKMLREQGLTVSEIKDNAEIQRILRKFDTEHKTDFIPPSAVERFIERTLTVIEKGI